MLASANMDKWYWSLYETATVYVSLKRWLNWPQWAKRSWWNVKSSFRNSSGTGQTSSSGQFLKLINMFTWIRSVSVNVSSFFSEEKMGALVHEFSLQSGWIVPVPVEGSGIRGSCGLFLRHSSWRPAWAHYIAVSDWSAPGLQTCPRKRWWLPLCDATHSHRNIAGEYTSKDKKDRKS